MRARPWDYAFIFHRALLQDLRATLPLPGSVYLDVGAGEQPYRKMYAEPGRAIVAIDIAPRRGLTSALAGMDDLPVRSQSCDVVLHFSTMACADDPIRAVREASRVLKPGGHLVLTEHQSWQQYGHRDRFHFTANGIRHLGASAGLELRSLRAQGSFWARTGIRINRAILPYSQSPWRFFRPLAYPIFLLTNLAFGLADVIWKLDGEAVNHLALFRKPEK